MNATLTDETILEKTGSHFGAPLSKITISDKQNDVISTTYKTHYAGKVYNCSIYYGTVKCEILGSSRDFGIAKTATAPARSERNAASEGTNIVQAQTRLNQLGYNVGRPDGIFGSKSKEKLKLFQKSSGLPMTGVLDAPTIDALR